LETKAFLIGHTAQINHETRKDKAGDQ